MFELQRRLVAAGSPVRSVAAHPGYASTELQSRTGNVFQNAFMAIGNRVVAQSGAQGAWPTLYAATQDIPGGSYVGPDGRGEIRGHPTLVAPNGAAQDEDVARGLWELSERLDRREVRDPAARRWRSRDSRPSARRANMCSCRTPSSTPTPPSRSWTAPRCRTSWRARRPSSATARWR